MYRIVRRIPIHGITKKYTRPSKVCKPVRHYSSKEKSLCPPPASSSGNSGTLYTIGAFALVGGATIGYAKHDPEFREWLITKAPFMDDLLKFIFQEERTYLESIIAALDFIKASFLELCFGESATSKKRRQIEDQPKDYTPPSAAFGPLAKKTKAPEETYAEIRIERKDSSHEPPTVSIGGDLKPKIEDIVLPDNHPKSLAELEIKIGESAAACIKAYNKAIFALKSYNQDVQEVVEESVDHLDPKIWESLRVKSRNKDDAIRAAEKHGKEAMEHINTFKEHLNTTDLKAPQAVRDQAQRNVAQVVEDIQNARRQLEMETQLASVTEKYWKKVEEARLHFIDELQILFPSINVSEKKLELAPAELDLFVLHAFSNILFYQKELTKAEILTEQKIKIALDSARKSGKDTLSPAQIEQQIEKEKRQLELDYEKKCLNLRSASERELRQQLKRQSEAFTDHLSDALQVREMEVERKLLRKLDEDLTEERCRYKLQLSAMVGRLRGMDKSLRARAEAEQASQQAQVLWSACSALLRSVKVGCPGLPWMEQLRPLDTEISAVKQASGQNDELVIAVIEGIPKEAIQRGVYPEDALRERFIKVEKVARNVALVPEGGARLPMFLLSYIQSFLLLKAASPIPQSELNNEEVDFKKLSTNDILQRARYWIDRGDFAQTLRYMNLLKGASRCVARQWMDETRILLETQQAANTLMAHAAASGLVYL